MVDRAQFTLQITLIDRFGLPMAMAVDLDQALRISPRAVDEIKMGFGGFDSTIELMKRREFRKQLFIDTATKLGHLLAERMEDAEGWHDIERIEPARKQLGGKW